MTEWVLRRDLDQPGEVRLFCLPHAGSGTAGFHRWKRLLPADIAVCPVALPGREARLAEPAIPCAETLVEGLVEALRPRLAEMPYAVFGHSMGALLAFRFAQRITGHGIPGPVRVFCSGREAPDFPAAPLASLEEGALLAALVRRFGPEAARGMQDTEMRAFFLPLLRADLRVVEGFRPVPDRLPCGISAWAGAEDDSVTDQGLKAWRAWSGDGFTQRRFAGDHFYPFGEGQAELLRALGHELAGAR